MKIAISSEGPGLESRVGHRLGTSPYLIIVNLETMAFEALKNPGAGSGSGMQAVALAIEQKVDVVLTGYSSPAAENYLKAYNIEVVTGIESTVSHVVEQYKRPRKSSADSTLAKPEKTRWENVPEALSKTAGQFGKMLPILISIVLLMGLFKAFISKELLLSIFSGNKIVDTIWGACFGSILPGNPINSYIIGGEMLDNGVNLFAVTAFMMTWVSVGLIQLPAEMVALEPRFSILRNSLSFVVSIGAAIVTGLILNLFGG
ncbi:MAG: NifB/NifX family molybdenum-iron cluster-binding protein [Deltaproteobacteria bacterium]|nr:NifB/NifX family molybdenum-iron cluster-binding protein [Deltaproteobacteria bacterium]